MQHRQSKHIVTSNTNYAGVSRIHHETEQATSNNSVHRKMGSTLQAYESLHRKELNQMNQYRQHLEKSMLAYTQRMKEISLCREDIELSFGDTQSRKELKDKEGYQDKNKKLKTEKRKKNTTTSNSLKGLPNAKHRKLPSQESPNGKRYLIVPKDHLRHRSEPIVQTGHGNYVSKYETGCPRTPNIYDLANMKIETNAVNSKSSPKTSGENVVTLLSETSNRINETESRLLLDENIEKDSDLSEDNSLEISPFPSLPAKTRDAGTVLVPAKQYSGKRAFDKKLRARKKLQKQDSFISNRPTNKLSRKGSNQTKLTPILYAATESKPTVKDDLASKGGLIPSRIIDNLVVHHMYKYSDALHSSLINQALPQTYTETRRDSLNSKILHATRRSMFDLPSVVFEEGDQARVSFTSDRRRSSTQATTLSGPLSRDLLSQLQTHHDNDEELTNNGEFNLCFDHQNHFKSNQESDSKQTNLRPTLKKDDSNLNRSKSVQFNLQNVDQTQF